MPSLTEGLCGLQVTGIRDEILVEAKELEIHHAKVTRAEPCGKGQCNIQYSPLVKGGIKNRYIFIQNHVT